MFCYFPESYKLGISNADQLIYGNLDLENQGLRKLIRIKLSNLRKLLAFVSSETNSRKRQTDKIIITLDNNLIRR